MQVQFDATIDDFVDVTLRSVAGSKALRAWRWEGAITFASLIGLSMYLILPGSTVAKLVAGVLAFVFIIFVSLATYKNSYQKRVRKLAKEQIGTEGPVRVQVELTESGIKFDQLKTQYIYDWSTIERYEETDDAIYFCKRDRSVLAVRKRAFESQESKDQFIEFAKKYLQPDSQTLTNG